MCTSVICDKEYNVFYYISHQKQNKRNDWFLMVKISKAEKEEIVKLYPDVQLTRTMRQDSKRHHYYMVEQPGPMRVLRKIRGIADPADGVRGNKGGRKGGNRNGRRERA